MTTMEQTAYANLVNTINGTKGVHDTHIKSSRKSTLPRDVQFGNRSKPQRKKLRATAEIINNERLSWYE